MYPQTSFVEILDIEIVDVAPFVDIVDVISDLIM